MENSWNDDSSTEVQENIPINTKNPFIQQTYNTNLVETNLENQFENRPLEVKTPEEMPFHEVILTNFEQLKSILAGLILLSACGLHIVWAIFQVLFYETSSLYVESLNKSVNATLNQDSTSTVETTSDSSINTPVISSTMTSVTTSVIKVLMPHHSYGFLLTIVSAWYFGVIIGCAVSGFYLVRSLRKKYIYFVSALLLIVSALFFFGASRSTVEWQILILFGRLLAGISHGITLVTIFVHASENASKEFRHYLTTFIGCTISTSIFLSTFSIYIPLPGFMKTENVAKYSELTSAHVITGVTFILASIAMVVNYYSHETFVFLFANNYEEEAIATLAKLNNENLLSPKLKEDVATLKDMYNDDNSEYARPLLFSGSHKSLMAFAMNARFASLFSLNVVVFVLLAKAFEKQILKHIMKDVKEIISEKDFSFEKLLVGLQELQRDIESLKHSIRIVISTWFVCGFVATIIGSYNMLRRSIHLFSFIAGLLLFAASFFSLIDSDPLYFKTLLLYLLIFYVLFKSMPADIIGYMYLSDCFPTSTKSYAIATITIAENLIHILLIALNLNKDLHLNVGKLGFSMFLSGMLLAGSAFKLFRSAPETRGLNLRESQHAFIQAAGGRKWWQS